MKRFVEGLGIGVGWLIAIAVAMIAALLLATMWTFSYGFFVDHTADRSGKTQVKQNTNGNGNYRIAAYDHFYDACANVQNDEASINALTTELKSTTDEQRKLVLQASLSAAQIKRSEDINNYNADARKAGTLGQFKASDLPGRLYVSTKETSCTAS